MKLMDLIGRNRETSGRKLYFRVPGERVLEEGFSSREIQPGKSYFQIRLSEMFLRNKAEYGSGFVPLVVSVNDFIYDDKRREIPFFVGNQLLKSIDTYIKGEHVELRNTRIVGPAPYAGDDVSLFVGLFRVQVDNLAKKLFGFLDNIIGAFGLANLQNYLEIAKQVGDGLGGLMGLSELEMRLGVRDVFGDVENSPNRFREGYLVYVNCPENAMNADNLWVKDGRLFTGSSKNTIEAFKKHDYCLIRIDELKTRKDYRMLPFHGLWKKAQKNVWEENSAVAEWRFLSLIQKVEISPDLTKDHRQRLMQVYLANFESEKQTWSKIRGDAARRPFANTRGAHRGKIYSSPRAEIQKTASLACKAGIPKTAEKALMEISANWDRIPDLKGRPRDFELTDEILDRQLNELALLSRIDSPDPSALADAIAFAAFNPV